MSQHQKAHAQSRLLHRMTHALGAMSNTIEDRKRQKYEGMLDVLMQHHLADPHYGSDSLRNHLLAHHLARAAAGNSNAFADSVAHNLLYHRLDKHIENQDNVAQHVAQYAARPLAAQQYSANSNAEELRVRTLQNQQLRPVQK